MNELLIRDLMEAMKEICLYEQRHAMQTGSARTMRKMVELYENGTWQGLDADRKLLYFQSIDNMLSGQPGEGFAFAACFKAPEERRVWGRFVTLQNQFDAEQSAELNARWAREAAAQSENAETAEPLLETPAPMPPPPCSPP